MRTLPLCLVIGISALPLSTGDVAHQEHHDPGKTALVGLAGVYQGLADSILANKRAEKSILHAILGVERDLALAALERARAAAPRCAAELQEAARHIGDFATEGGAVIEPIRNRLLQGGHHHHHAQQPGSEVRYDRGYVVLTRKLKLEALDLAKRCARLAASGEVAAGQVDEIAGRLTALAERCLK